jgi:hypothetical protein
MDSFLLVISSVKLRVLLTVTEFFTPAVLQRVYLSFLFFEGETSTSLHSTTALNVALAPSHLPLLFFFICSCDDIISGKRKINRIYRESDRSTMHTHTNKQKKKSRWERE